jgi:GTPase
MNSLPESSPTAANSNHRSGFVAVVGRPNVGKSTLVNCVLRQRIASVSPWPQTTRRRQLGILTLPEAQIVLMDTPGLHHPRSALGRSMMRVAEETLGEADLILYLTDLSKPPDAEEGELADWVRRVSHAAPVLLALNKQDRVANGQKQDRIDSYRRLIPEAAYCVLSAENGDGVPELLASIAQALPVGPAYFPEEDITDLTERQMAEDIVHEAALRNLRDEVGHGVAVRIDSFSERKENGAHIDATLFVERESHKPIVIGRGGSMLKTIGTAARLRLEEMRGGKVFLQLRVKVLPRWRESEQVLRRLGFRPPEG